MNQGFSFHDWVVSTKQQLPMRRIKLNQTEAVYQLRPDFVMPYMVGKTDEISASRGACLLTRALTFSVVIRCIGIAFISP